MRSVTICDALLRNYVGGEAEITDEETKSFYRGPVESAHLRGTTVILKFAWLAKNLEFPAGANWVKEEKLELHQEVKLDRVSALNIGPGQDGSKSDDRICLSAPLIGKLFVFFPPNGTKLNPESVQGLKL